MAVKFVDEAKIFIKAGDGGKGCVAFEFVMGSRHKRRPIGGMGGDGGSVIVVGNSGLTTLMDFKYQQHYMADKGEGGGGNNRYGRNAADLIIQVPLGTVFTGSAGESFEIIEPNQPVVVQAGGKGGRGNAKLRNLNIAVNHQGEVVVGQWWQLELKLFADVGVIGMPNAGKSSLVRAISGARPKVGDYPFTTLYPTLGVVEGDAGQRFTVADIPGLIAGAHEGAGLGNRFLRHIARTKLLVHMLDVGEGDVAAVMQHYQIVEDELKAQDPQLVERQQLVLINKIDQLDNLQPLEPILELFAQRRIKALAVSVLKGDGMAEAKEAMTALVFPKLESLAS